MASRATILLCAVLAVCWTARAARPLVTGVASPDGTSGVMEQLISHGRRLHGGCSSGVEWPLDSCDIHTASDITCGDEDAPACCYDDVCCSRANGGGGTCDDPDAYLGCCSGKKKL